MAVSSLPCIGVIRLEEQPLRYPPTYLPWEARESAGSLVVKRVLDFGR